MKLKKIFGNVGNSIKEFPLSYFLLLVLTILAIISIFASNDYGNLCLATGLALILSLYLPIYNLQKKQKTEKQWLKIGGIVIPIIIGIIYFFIIRTKDIFGSGLSTSEILSYGGIFILATIGLYVLLALTSKKDENKTRYSRLGIIAAGFMGGVACGVIGGGIAGALAAIEALFDVRISSEVYEVMRAIVGILISGSFILNYYQYLLSNATDIKATNAWNSRIRKVFGNYIFFGLTLIYICIFLVYGAKILITGVRPKGIICWLGIGYFSLGLVTTFLIQPQENKFSKIVSNGIDYSFIYTAFMMICAIIMRIKQHGFTMNRYFVCAVILLILIYTVLTLIKSKNRRLIFSSSLFIIALFSIYGPVNAKNISLNSQINRLREKFSEQNISLPILKGGLSELTGEESYDTYNLLYNLYDNYDFNKWNKGFIDENISLSLTGDSGYERRNQFFEFLGLKINQGYTDIDREGNKVRYFDFSAVMVYPLNIEGYSQIYEVSSRDKCYDEPKIEGGCRQEDNVISFNGTLFDLNKYKNEIINAESEKGPIIWDMGDSKLIVTSLYGEIKGEDNLKLSSFYGYLLKK